MRIKKGVRARREKKREMLCVLHPDFLGKVAVRKVRELIPFKMWVTLPAHFSPRMITKVYVNACRRLARFSSYPSLRDVFTVTVSPYKIINWYLKKKLTWFCLSKCPCGFSSSFRHAHSQFLWVRGILKLESAPPSTMAGDMQSEKHNPFPQKPVSKCKDDLIKGLVFL